MLDDPKRFKETGDEQIYTYIMDRHRIPIARGQAERAKRVRERHEEAMKDSINHLRYGK